MSDLYQKSLIKLELNRVLQRLAECAGSAEGKKACLDLMPVSNVEDVRELLSETTAASNLSIKKGYPGFAGVHDTSQSLDRANRGGTLQPKELLEIAGVLRCIRTVKDYTSKDEDSTVLDRYFYALTPNKFLEERIFTAIISEEEFLCCWD